MGDPKLAQALVETSVEGKKTKIERALLVSAYQEQLSKLGDEAFKTEVNRFSQKLDPDGALGDLKFCRDANMDRAKCVEGLTPSTLEATSNAQIKNAINPGK